MTNPCPIGLRGIVPSLNTPFLEDGGLDEASLRRLIDHTVDSGCVGMLALAVAGEQASLSIEEKFEFLDIAAGQNQNRIPLIVSVTSSDFEESVALAKRAATTGAQGICYQPLPDLSQTRLIETLLDLSAAGPDLLMIQDLDWSGDGMSLADITALYDKVPKLKCLKIETVPAGPKYTRVLEATSGQLHVSGGWAVSQLMDALMRGVHAFIPTGMEAAYVALYNQYQAGNEDKARAPFEQLLPVLAFSNQHIDISIQFFKKARQAEGIFTTDVCRSPATSFDTIQSHECDQAVSRYLNLIEAVSSPISVA